MNTPRTLLILFLASWPIANIAGADSNAQSTTQLQWQADKPTCFDPSLPLSERFDSVPRMMVGGEMTEPEKIEGENLKTEHFDGVELRTGIPVLEIVINTDGNVESVLSLRTTTPEFDKRLGEVISTWVFKPASVEGKPICIRYILTLRIQYR